jgi:proline dehydrogenase
MSTKLCSRLLSSTRLLNKSVQFTRQYPLQVHQRTMTTNPQRFYKTKLLLKGSALAFTSGYVYTCLDEFLFPSTRSRLSTLESSSSSLKSKNFLELLNNYVVFKTCQIPGIVTMVPYLLNIASIIKVEAFIYWVVKHTFFSHFCGGEDAEEVFLTMQRFKNNNIGSILDLSIEADMKTDEISGIESSLEDLIVQSDNVIKLILESINTASIEPNSFIAMKMTAVIPPFLLKKLTDIFSTLQKSFNNVHDDNDGYVSLQQFHKVLSCLPGSIQLSREQVGKLFTEMDKDKDGKIDWIDFSDGFSYLTHQPLSSSPILHNVAKTLFSNAYSQSPNDLVLSSCELKLLEHIMRKIDSICRHAESKKVRIMIDAEQSYFQPAIDHIALTFSKVYNSQCTSMNDSIIFNTYQMYLKDAYMRLLIDFERSRRNNYHFGAKLVRGAYILSERALAKERGYEDPILPDINTTHYSFDRSILFLVSHISNSKLKYNDKDSLKTKIIIASHNKSSIHLTMQFMEDLKLNPRDGDIYFAQLMGMQDLMTFNLAAKGYNAYKYIPYGPVSSVMPYLLRRAQENSAFFGSVGAIEDIADVVYELKRRTLPGFLFKSNK